MLSNCTGSHSRFFELHFTQSRALWQCNLKNAKLCMSNPYLIKKQSKNASFIINPILFNSLFKLIEPFVTTLKKREWFLKMIFSLCQTSFLKALWLISLAHHQFLKLKAFIYWSFFVTEDYFNYANRQVVNTFSAFALWATTSEKFFPFLLSQKWISPFHGSTFFYDYAISFA